MKKLFILLLTLFCISCIPLPAQIKGLDSIETMISIETTTSSDDFYEVPYKITPEGYLKSGCLICFRLTPVGLKHCIKKIKKLVILNNLDFNNPNFLNDELYSNFVEGITDYKNLNLSLSTGNAEIKKYWLLGNNYSLGLYLGEYFYLIIVFPPRKLNQDVIGFTEALKLLE